MEKTLYTSEWVLVGGLVVILCSLVAIAKINAYRSSSIVMSLGVEEVAVTIEGAVDKPGTYVVPVGMPLDEVVRKAKPKRGADLNSLPLREIVEKPLQLQVEMLKEVRVTVRGEVLEPVEVLLPLESRICDLKDKISLREGADPSFFRRKKRLQDGEIVEVPKKTVE